MVVRMVISDNLLLLLNATLMYIVSSMFTALNFITRTTSKFELAKVERKNICNSKEPIRMLRYPSGRILNCGGADSTHVYTLRPCQIKCLVVLQLLQFSSLFSDLLVVDNVF